jgi:hypothetical protein
MTKAKYCKDALQLLGIKTVCGADCPLLKKCPRLILEDATDAAITEAMQTMIQITKAGVVCKRKAG